MIVVSVVNNLIQPFLFYSKQEEHEKYTYQFTDILCTFYYRQFDFQVQA